MAARVTLTVTLAPDPQAYIGAATARPDGEIPDAAIDTVINAIAMLHCVSGVIISRDDRTRIA
jgi:hypothetical protein